MDSTVVFFKQLGDFVLLQPALARLLADGPSPADNRVTVVANPAFLPVLDLAGHDGRAVLGKPCGRRDQLLAFERGTRNAWAALTVRSPHKKIVLSKDEEIRWFHRAVFDEIVVDPASREYRAQYYWKHAPGPADPAFQPPRLSRPPAEWAGRHAIAGDYILVHPTSAWKRKCWPAGHWHEALKLIGDHAAFPRVITSGPAEWETAHARDVASGIPGNTRCLAGETTLRELIHLIAGARLVLAVDGAVAHLAAALGRPSIVLFGPANPLHWHLPTAHNKALSARDYCPERRPSAEHIPVADLVTTAKSLLHAEARP